MCIKILKMKNILMVIFYAFGVILLPLGLYAVALFIIMNIRYRFGLYDPFLFICIAGAAGFVSFKFVKFVFNKRNAFLGALCSLGFMIALCGFLGVSAISIYKMNDKENIESLLESKGTFVA